MDENSVGRRIARVRKTLGWTQQQLAETAKVSKSTLAKVETGHSSASTQWLGSVARALGVDTGYLNGAPYRNNDPEQAELHRNIPAVRRAIESYELIEPEDVPQASLAELAQQLDQVSRWRRDTAYHKIGAALPALLEGLSVATKTAPDDERERAYALLAIAYRNANTLAHKLGYSDLSLTAVRRVGWAADLSGDPLLSATAGYLRATALARIGDGAHALRLIERTAGQLEPLIHTEPEALFVYGSLHMRAITIAAAMADADASASHLDEADRAARMTGPDKLIHETVFGPTNVRLHALAAAVDLGQPGEAVRLVTSAPLGETATKERETYFHIDAARAYLLNGKPDAAIDELWKAREIAPVHFRSSGTVRGAIQAIAAQQYRASDGLRQLANAAGVQPTHD